MRRAAWLGEPTHLGPSSAPEALPKAGGCRRPSAWTGPRRLSPTPPGAGTGEGLGTDVPESGHEL